MNIISKAVKSLSPYERNNKKHDQQQIDNVAESIKQFGFVQPLVVDKDNVVVIGHCRLLAAKKLGMTEVPCVCVDELTDEQVRKLRIVDNKTNESEWDFDNLAAELPDLDFSDFEFDFGIAPIDVIDTEPNEQKQNHSLAEIFGCPPFSIIDTRRGYWQDRKRAWREIGIKSEVGRGKSLLGAGLKQLADKYLNGNEQLQGTSIFDPALTETMYKWFCPPNGKIFDCFAGGSVRGAVAAKLGYEYHGIDLRQEQIDANIANAELIGVSPNWYCDDSLNADKYVDDNTCDMIFTCPPYADLEVYSDDERDISNMSYDDFCKVYHEIISIACRKLKDDRFAVFVVGDVRDENGFYRNLVDYTKKCFNDNGLLTYNDMVLIETAGTAQLRAKKQFNSMRKVVKMHQNILVFYKGIPQAIKSNFDKIEISDEAVEEDD